MRLFTEGPYTTAAGPRRQWSHFTIWAEDGLIFLHDPEPAPDEREYTVMTCRDARERLGGWATKERDILDKRRTAAVNPQEKAFCNDGFFKMKQMIEVLEATLEEAVAQGDQSDPEVAYKKQLEFMRRKYAGRGIGVPNIATWLDEVRKQNKRRR